MGFNGVGIISVKKVGGGWKRKQVKRVAQRADKVFFAVRLRRVNNNAQIIKGFGRGNRYQERYKSGSLRNYH
jgi:hypothetical protein